MSAARHHVHTATIAVRFGDMDALGHVNNAAYFTFMEQARVEWWHKVEGDSGTRAFGPVVASASCNFRVPVVYPVTLEVRMYLANPGRTSVESHYEIGSGSTAYADGAARIVWIELATGRPSPLPERIVSALRALTP
jgi:acyl-CoA thioester hydrolase